MKGALGEVRAQRVEERVETDPGEGGNDDTGGWGRLGEVGGGWNEIGLRIDRDDRRPGHAVELRHLRERGRGKLRQRMQVRDDLGVRDGPQGGGPHRLVQLVLGLEQPGRVGEDELSVVAREQTDYRQAGGPGAWGEGW